MSQLQGEHPTADSLVSEISAALRLDVVEGADPTLICFSGVRGPVDPVSIEVLETIAARLTEHPVVGLSRYTGSTFEILLALEDAPLHAFRYRRDEFKLADPERGLEYELGVPSHELCLGLLLQLRPTKDRENAIRLRRSILPLGMRGREPSNVLEVISRGFRRSASLRITSTENRTAADFRRYINSFIFHVAYNMNLCLAIASPETLLPPAPVRRGPQRRRGHGRTSARIQRGTCLAVCGGNGERRRCQSIPRVLPCARESI